MKYRVYGHCVIKVMVEHCINCKEPNDDIQYEK